MQSTSNLMIVSRSPIFRGLPLRVCSTLIERADRVLFAQGDTLIEEGAQGDCAYLVATGEISRLATAAVDLETVTTGPGTMVGEMAMLIDTRYGSTIVAETEVQALRFHRAVMHELMQSDPSIAAHFVEKIRQRLVIFAEKLRVLDKHIGSDTAIGA